MSDGIVGGRPSVLQRLSVGLQKSEHEILVDWIAIEIEKPMGAKARIAKKYNIDQASVYRALAKLSQPEIDALRLEAKGIADRVPTNFYAIKEDGTLYSDYEEINGFIASKFKVRRSTLISYLIGLKQFWLIAQRRHPKNWNDPALIDRVFTEYGQRRSYKCPECGKQYSERGLCSKDSAVLVEKVAVMFNFIVSFRRFASFMGWAQTVTKYDTKQSKGAKLKKDYIRPEELDSMLKIAPQMSLYTQGDLDTAVRLQTVLGGREGHIDFGTETGGIIGTYWENVNWEKATMNTYERKTAGGFFWEDCPLDLFDDLALSTLKKYWETCGKPVSGRIFKFNYPEYLEAFKALSKRAGIKRNITPHILRKTHATMCGEADIPLEIVAGDAPHGLVGVGWEDIKTLKNIYMSISQRRLGKYLEKARGLNVLNLKSETDSETETDSEEGED